MRARLATSLVSFIYLSIGWWFGVTDKRQAMTRGAHPREWYVLTFPNYTWGMYHLSATELADITFREKTRVFKMSQAPEFRTQLDQLDLSMTLSDS
jgi:hypothetical protein